MIWEQVFVFQGLAALTQLGGIRVHSLSNVQQEPASAGYMFAVMVRYQPLGNLQGRRSELQRERTSAHKQDYLLPAISRQWLVECQIGLMSAVSIQLNRLIN